MTSNKLKNSFVETSTKKIHDMIDLILSKENDIKFFYGMEERVKMLLKVLSSNAMYIEFDEKKNIIEMSEISEALKFKKIQTGKSQTLISDFEKECFTDLYILHYFYILILYNNYNANIQKILDKSALSEFFNFSNIINKKYKNT